MLKGRIGPGPGIFGGKLFEGVHQRFGDETPPELAESPRLIGNLTQANADRLYR